VRQAAGVHVNGEAGKATVLVSAVKRLSIPKHPQCGSHLLDGMGRRATGRVDGAPPRGLVADGSEQPVEHRPRQAETLLKRVFSVDQRLPVHTEVISQNGVRTQVKIARPVGATAWTGASSTLAHASFTYRWKRTARGEVGSDPENDGHLQIIISYIVVHAPRAWHKPENAEREDDGESRA